LEKRSIDKKVDMGFEVLKMKATKAATSAVSDLLAEQQYQKELLELEQTMLESKLQALRKGKGT
jgi:hypothetical protein